MPNEGQATFDVEVMTAIEHDIPKLKEDIANLKAIAGQGDPAKVANLQRTLALVPIADLDDMILALCDYVDLLDPRVQLDPSLDDMREAELLIAKIRGHLSVGAEHGGYAQYCRQYESEKDTNDRPLSYSEWVDAGRPYNHPDHKN